MNFCNIISSFAAASPPQCSGIAAIILDCFFRPGAESQAFFLRPGAPRKGQGGPRGKRIQRHCRQYTQRHCRHNQRGIAASIHMQRHCRYMHASTCAAWPQQHCHHMHAAALPRIHTAAWPPCGVAASFKFDPRILCSGGDITYAYLFLSV